MPIDEGMVHTFRQATIRLIENVSLPSDPNVDDDKFRQIRSLCSALLAALPSAERRGGRPPGSPESLAMAARR
jgi:hypothetical protein